MKVKKLNDLIPGDRIRLDSFPNAVFTVSRPPRINGGKACVYLTVSVADAGLVPGEEYKRLFTSDSRIEIDAGEGGK